MATRRFGPDEGLGYAPQERPLTIRELLGQRDDALRRLAEATKRIDELEDIELELRGQVSEYRQAVLAHLSNTGYAGEPSPTRLELMRVAGVRS